jgi:hypothetical protein
MNGATCLDTSDNSIGIGLVASQGCTSRTQHDATNTVPGHPTAALSTVTGSVGLGIIVIRRMRAILHAVLNVQVV